MALAIFLITYVFIAGFKVPGLPIDRTGGALLGAAAMVAFRVVSPSQIVEAVDVDTIILLFGMMLLATYLTRAGFFRSFAYTVLKHSHSPRKLLLAIVGVSGVLSAFLVNDTVCLMLTPLVLLLVTSADLPPLPYLLALCMASNAGSAATFTGNPQNMIIGVASKIPWGQFALVMAVPALLSMAVVAGVLLVVFRKQLAFRPIAPQGEKPVVDRKLLWLCLAALTGIIAAFLLGLSMAWSALVGAAVVMLVARIPPEPQFKEIDFSLLVFFACLFIVVFGVNEEGWGTKMHDAFGGAVKTTVGFSLLTLIGSNVFSNVPFVMLARQWVSTPLEWEVLSLASTLAGNLTIVGSVANLIVFEGAKGRVQISFWEYLKVGVPATLLSLVVGVGALLLIN